MLNLVQKKCQLPSWHFCLGGLIHRGEAGREFIVAEPHRSWVRDIRYSCTHEGRLYRAVVVEWPMGRRIDTGLVLNALMPVVASA